MALESGAIHARLEQEPALTVYTAQIQAQTVAIGDDPREFLVGFENPGMMCIRTYRGAMRVEQQLSGQSVIVPQGEDVMLANGQIDKHEQRRRALQLRIADRESSDDSARREWHVALTTTRRTAKQRRFQGCERCWGRHRRRAKNRQQRGADLHG